MPTGTTEPPDTPAKDLYLLREPTRTIRAYPISSDQSLLASILLNPLYNAMQYLVFLSILFVEEQNNSDL